MAADVANVAADVADVAADEHEAVEATESTKGMLAHADVCWRMTVMYADVCWRMAAEVMASTTEAEHVQTGETEYNIYMHIYVYIYMYIRMYVWYVYT